MERKTITLKELKRRKILLVLPVLILPFITLLFWSLGGGKDSLASSADIEEKKGFNTALPDPRFKDDSALDKMSYYEQATMDSIKFEEQIKKDPNYSGTVSLEDSLGEWEVELESKGFRKDKAILNTTFYKDQNQQKVYQRLKALHEAISEPEIVSKEDQDMREFQAYGSSSMESADLRKLEQLVSVINKPQDLDPELRELGDMLENILDIQHPARVQEKLRESLEHKNEKSLRVVKKSKENNISSLEMINSQDQSSKISSKSNSFYSLEQDLLSGEEQNAIEAVIHQTQSIVNGSTIKLRLNNDVLIGGTQIAKNSFLYGIAALKGERLEVKITSIKYENSIFPIQLSVYDMDGIEGIYIPGAINRDVAKASADRSIETLGVANLNDSWGAQATGMGIEAAKSLMSKKVKLVKVVVKAGYQVLLYDQRQKDSN